jgi:hypothetical protein
MRPKREYRLETDLTDDEKELCRDKALSGTVYDAADLVGCHWKTVRKLRLEHQFSKPPVQRKGVPMPTPLSEEDVTFIRRNYGYGPGQFTMGELVDITKRSRKAIRDILHRRTYPDVDLKGARFDQYMQNNEIPSLIKYGKKGD